MHLCMEGMRARMEGMHLCTGCMRARMEGMHKTGQPSPPAPLPHGERGDSAPGHIRLPLSRSGRGGWGVRAERRQTVKYLQSMHYRRSNAVMLSR